MKLTQNMLLQALYKLPPVDEVPGQFYKVVVAAKAEIPPENCQPYTCGPLAVVVFEKYAGEWVLPGFKATVSPRTYCTNGHDMTDPGSLNFKGNCLCGDGANRDAN